jgi:hypothetical protein
MMVVMMTIFVEEMIVALFGHATFFISRRHSLKYLKSFFISISQTEVLQARRDSNPQHPVLETSALTVGATGLYSSIS